MNNSLNHRLSRNMLAALIPIVALAMPLMALAQTTTTQNTTANTNNYTLLAPLPCIQGDPGCTLNTQTTTVNLNEYLIYAFNLFIAIAAVAAVFMIVWGGFEYMVSASANTKSDGLKKARNALIGLLMVLGAYLILQTINPALVNVPGSLVPSISTPATETSSSLFNQLQGKSPSGSTNGSPSSHQ